MDSEPQGQINQILSKDCQDGEFKQIYGKLRDCTSQEEVVQVLQDIISKKKSKQLAPQIFKILGKNNVKLPPVQLMCHQLRKKGLDVSDVNHVKKLFLSGQRYVFALTLNKLIGKQSEQIVSKYGKLITDKQVQPMDGSKFLFKKNGLNFYKYPELCLTPAQKSNAKVLMVLGETGCGKSTFLNSLINYFSQVQINYPFRYQIIVQDVKDQTKSITKQINTYYVRNIRNGKVYKLVDTPGFGDTDGHKSDENLIKKISNQFTKQLDIIDCVMFVVKSSNVRLNHYQRYIFQSILDLFGKDVAANFCFILTFTDGGDPPVLPCLKNNEQGFGKYWNLVPDPKYVSVNNGAFFHQIDLKDQIKTKYWDIGVESMKRLENRVQKCKSASLRLTKVMLRTKQALSNKIRATRQKIQDLTAIQMNIKREIQVISSFEKQINSTKQFYYDTQQIQYYGQQTQNNVTRCNNCTNSNCHDNCRYGDGQEKKNCAAMQDEYCKICPGKCHYVAHTNSHTLRKTRQVTKTNTNYELKKRYDQSTKGKTTTQKALVQKFKKLDQIYVQTNKAHQQMFELNKQLQKMCLSNKKAQSLIQYLKIQIQNEYQFKTNGYLDRIRQLELTLKQAQINKDFLQGKMNISKEQVFKQLKEQRYKTILANSTPSIFQSIKGFLGF